VCREKQLLKLGYISKGPCPFTLRPGLHLAYSAVHLLA